MLNIFNKCLNLQITKKYLINNNRYYSTISSSSSSSSSGNIKSEEFKNSDAYIISKNNKAWEVIIGIEVHAQTKSKEKLFSDSANIGSMEGFRANSRVSFTDAAFPGTLPILNEKCVEQAIKTGLALGAKINKYSYFDRKHYFYQDLPQGYQITQYNEPIVKGGQMLLNLSNQRQKLIRISHIQLEQDSGKSIHDIHPTLSFVDLNRAGIGLMEIVSHADFNSSEQVGAYIKQLQHLLKHIGSSDANMQFGEMRCDVNISVHEPNTPLGTRVELKNMISAKAIMGSIDAEAQRQIEILENGGKIQRETRGFNQETGQTFHLRTKQDEVDYRFFSEPDLPPLIISDSQINRIRENLGELPQDMKQRIIRQYSLNEYDASLLMEDQRVAKYFEESIHFNSQTKPREIKKILPWILKEMFSWMNQHNQSFQSIPISVKRFCEFLDLIESGLISTRAGKTIFDKMLSQANEDNNFTSMDLDPKALVDSLGLSQISDDEYLDKLCHRLVIDHPTQTTEYKSGKTRVYKFFIGEIMKLTKGRSNPEKVNLYLKKYLDTPNVQK
ncbi:glutamyl-tRNA(Gln) amidotransferase B subunit [Tieghemostelium lacteum]|uniref:Glutamyl-tRNA(Gln) amidotransferase subunit B, mitochondrial n=1 Tax=Tieghemostelium lacteum TaxID=361077 RepID=A0A152A6S3_TIELA|nr:glutamyl-tRNA(Gln) amidotransferase B subunit [Tieghemostelium lacteum]|eukprot:KYR01914.1 glutamyl-tRNA(Gln) amidotransferase B subunit [Tieghemostelium lacteum]